jgi:hypothetical protein
MTIDGGTTVMHCRALTQADFDRWINAFRTFIAANRAGSGHRKLPSTSFTSLGPGGSLVLSATPDAELNPILESVQALKRVSIFACDCLLHIILKSDGETSNNSP